MGQKEVYDYIKANPGCTINDMVEHFNQHRETIGVYVNKLYKQEVIMKERDYVGWKRHPIWRYRVKE